MDRISLNVVRSNKKINLCYKPLKVVILRHQEDGNSVRVSLKDALKMLKNNEVVLGQDVEALSYAKKSLLAYMSMSQRIDLNSKIKRNPTSSWLEALQIYTEFSTQSFNKAGLKII